MPYRSQGPIAWEPGRIHQMASSAEWACLPNGRVHRMVVVIEWPYLSDGRGCQTGVSTK